MGEKASRAELKEQSRQRLIKAAITVLGEQGMSRLTTGKIARAAGLSQPSFYVHFADMEDLLSSVADQVVRPVQEVLTKAMGQLGNISSDTMGETLRTAWSEALDALLEERAVAEVLLAHRRDRTTPLGKGIRKAQDELLASLVSIFQTLHSKGPAGSTDPKVEAELTLAVALGALEGLLDGRIEREPCLDSLVLVMSASAAEVAKRATSGA